MIGGYADGAASDLIALAALQQAHDPALDSVRVESPLPGGVAAVVRFLLNTVPPWIQMAGVVIAFVVAVAIVWFLLKHRIAIVDWFFSRAVITRFAIAGATLAIFTTVAWAGAATWNYTQHSNDFCSGCHVMNVAYGKMTGGTSKHAKLSCHACHQQSIYASAHQLYMWVSERPDKIEKHAHVPNSVCEKCHVTQDTAAWQRIASTAGHRVHLESDSSALRNVKCVDCHGTELHRFVPAKQTCGQSGCHTEKQTQIKLAKMSGQTVRHCTVCHEFTASVPVLATRDSARGTLVPGASQCLGCHRMQAVLPDFDAEKDPHGGKCGTCHNPHTQRTSEAAAKSCAASGCHSNWRDEPFHVGAAHQSVATQCLTCHRPHAAQVDASACEACHLRVRSRGKFRPPLPFDTAAALRRGERDSPRDVGSALPPEPPGQLRIAFAASAETAPKPTHDAWLALISPTPALFPVGTGPPPPPTAAPESFPHARHEKIACLVCHQTGDGHGLLTFERPRGCAICHHQAPARTRCARCHEGEEYNSPKQLTATVTVAGHPPRPRPVVFLHSIHTPSRACVDCHTTPVTLAPPPAKATCRDCHESHHAKGRECSACHSVTQPKTAHSNIQFSHQRCDACHTPTTIAKLTPTRSFCSTCHTTKSTEHYPQKECTVCHFLTEPDTFKASLMTRARE